MKRKSNIIALLTDFGYSDTYAGVLKGVILKLNPQANIIDLLHGIEPQNIIQGAIELQNAYAFFPDKTIFVAVVDPGVGTSRKIICVKTSRYFFIGPDNGLLGLALKHEKIEAIRQVNNSNLFAKRLSSTFHGRDIMSPVAARLSLDSGIFSKLGPLVHHYLPTKIPAIQKGDKSITAEILYFDYFGNAITNIGRQDLPSKDLRISVKNRKIGGLSRVYDKSKTCTALINSSDRLEIACANGSAQKKLDLRRGDKIQIKWSH